MGVRITRLLEFDYGHRLVGHEGKCRDLHGHRGTVEITVESTSLDSCGRVVDFSVVKELVGGWIDSNIDHKMILNPDDRIIPALAAAGEKMYLMPRNPRSMSVSYGSDGMGMNPTAENLVALIARKSVELLSECAIKVVSVRLYETPNCWADFTF